MKLTGRELRTGMVSALALGVVLLATPCRGQDQYSQSQYPSGVQQGKRTGQVVPPDMNPALAIDQGDPRMQERWKRMFNEHRHSDIVADTKKLLQLTAELKAEIDSTHATVLTDAELRKVAEIQKLAHNVRQNMTFAIQQPSVFPDVQMQPTLPPLHQ